MADDTTNGLTPEDQQRWEEFQQGLSKKYVIKIIDKSSDEYRQLLSYGVNSGEINPIWVSDAYAFPRMLSGLSGCLEKTNKAVCIVEAGTSIRDNGPMVGITRDGFSCWMPPGVSDAYKFIYDHPEVADNDYAKYGVVGWKADNLITIEMEDGQTTAEFITDVWNNRGVLATKLQSFFFHAKSARTPLVLDLDGDGIETTAVNTGTTFDHNSDGFAEDTGWVKGDDGLLVFDRNNNGVIDNGTELFGNNTVMSNGQKAGGGFQALADLDSNKDGKIDLSDTQFANLKVWQDANQDGYSAVSEMKTLSDVGINSISLAYTAPNTQDAYGNTNYKKAA
jgi:hypothetical protein